MWNNIPLQRYSTAKIANKPYTMNIKRKENNMEKKSAIKISKFQHKLGKYKYKLKILFNVSSVHRNH